MGESFFLFSSNIVFCCLQEEKAKAKRKENTALLFDPKKLKQQLLQKQREEEAAARGETLGEGAPPAITDTNHNDTNGTVIHLRTSNKNTAKKKMAFKIIR